MKQLLFFQQDLQMVEEYFLILKELDINKELTIGFKVGFNREVCLLKYTTTTIMVELKKNQHFYTRQG